MRDSCFHPSPATLCRSSEAALLSGFLGFVLICNATAEAHNVRDDRTAHTRFNGSTTVPADSVF
jgi:hypothetical protein